MLSDDRHPPMEPPASIVRTSIAHDADSLDASLAELASTLRGATPDSSSERRVRLAFRTARRRYKHVEGAVELYAPALAAALNSRRQEVDDDDAPPPSTLAPTGFPALEALLWPRLEASHTDSAIRIVEGMRPLARRLRSLAPSLVPTESQVVEIARLEIARVSTLGIAGFDAPRTGESLRECADALDGVRDLIEAAGPGLWPRLESERDSLERALADAAYYLRAHPGFRGFNRLAFITGYADPAARALDALRRASGTTALRIPRAWRVEAASVYGDGAFDVGAYAPSGTPRATPALVALGARLFADPSLSGSGTRSCASCHDPRRSFADGVARAASIGPVGSRVLRNTPTLLNAALQPAQFADERSVTLEDQVLEVLRSPTEMGSSAERAARSLSGSAEYRSSFASAFGDARPSAISALRVRQALAAYMRTLVALDSRFDRAVRGDTTAMTAKERHGFTLFMGKAGCGTCHFAPLFSGNTPPLYMSSDVEVIGTPASPSRPSRLDSDSGRARVDHLALHVRAFKTPSLRNVSATGPYMHNGAFRTLDEVVRFYDAGGGLGAGARIGNQTLSADSLHLTSPERAAIVAFLGALGSRGR
jgi:cytochrome c peroxidase